MNQNACIVKNCIHTLLALGVPNLGDSYDLVDELLLVLEHLIKTIHFVSYLQIFFKHHQHNIVKVYSFYTEC